MENLRSHNICFVIYSLQGGGAERVISILSERLIEAGAKVSIIIFIPNDAKIFYPIFSEVKIHRLFTEEKGGFIIRKFSKVKALRYFFKTSGFTHVISFTRPVNYFSILAAIGLRLKLIVSERNFPIRFGSSQIKRSIGPFFLYPLADFTVVQTKLMAKEYRFLRNSRVIGNPVRPMPMVQQDFHHIERILCVGRLVHQKGYDLLLPQLCKVFSQYPNLILEIYGDGPLRTAIERQAKELGIGDKVKLMGVVSPIKQAFEMGGIFVMSSRYEGFPNALAEAMASGLPSISHSCPSGPETLIIDGHNGVLVPMDRRHGIEEALLRLIADPQLCESISKNAVRVSETFSVNSTVEKWSSLF